MHGRDIISTTTIEETLALLADRSGSARLIAGGTDLLIELREGRIPDSVTLFIDIEGVRELSRVREEDGKIRVGAGLKHADCVLDPVLCKKAPLLAAASSWVGSPQIRNRGTIGGNVVTAAACADTVPALVAMDAACVLAFRDAGGRVTSREVLVSDFITGAGSVDIRPEELLTEVNFPVPDRKMKWAYEKLVRRNALVKARMTIAALGYTASGGTAAGVSIALGSVTPRPVRFTAAEQTLLGKKPSEELFKAAAENVSAEILDKTGYRWSTEYKKPVAEALTIRALEKIFGRGTGS